MCCRITGELALVVSTCDYFTIDHDERPYGHITVFGRSLGLGDRQGHQFGIVKKDISGVFTHAATVAAPSFDTALDPNRPFPGQSPT